MFPLAYNKNKTHNLFKQMESRLPSTLTQNYIPIYTKYFSLNQDNYNNINLNQCHGICEIVTRETENIYTILTTDGATRASFFKYSPLIDPGKYLVGKYKDSDVCVLPAFGEANKAMDRISDCDNAAYVDGFFSFLSSKLLHDAAFPHGVDFYGSFLCIKEDYRIDVSEDMEYLCKSDYFFENRNKLFTIDSELAEHYMNEGTRRNKKTLVMEDISCCLSLSSTDEYANVFIVPDAAPEVSYELVYEQQNEGSKQASLESSSTSISSNSSHTNNSNSSSDYSSEFSSIEEEPIECIVKRFPTQIICLEKLNGTLDSLIEDDTNPLDEKEWASLLFQTIMILVVYQKVFSFTHNDLHTNNIMYVRTDKRYLNYKYGGAHYKVPTHGRLFKIIDFGRSIYTYKGVVCCSDSFHPKGDAAGQYNCEPYYNPKKDHIGPNTSFDLCRLGCSLFDVFFDDVTEKPGCAIAKLVREWCTDDKGRNVLYKKSGEERYEDFKLYKMIARTVHAHSPQKYVGHKVFSNFKTGRKNINKKAKIIDVDSMIQC
jgi:hypothetical protein